MYDLLIQIGVQPLVADFIAHPEWLHIGTALALTVFIIGACYLLRLDLDPFLFGRPHPVRMVTERIIFYVIILFVLIYTYYYKPAEGITVADSWYTFKFIKGCSALFLLVVGRAVTHFIISEKNRWDFFDQLPFYLMVLFMFFVPNVGYFKLERNMLMPKEQLGFAMACIFLGYFVIRMLVGRPINFPRTRVNLFMLLFVAYMLLTVIVFPYRLAAVKNIIQWIAWAGCFMFGFALIPDKRRRDAVLLTAVIAATFSTLWGFWKYFDIPYHLLGLNNGTYPEGHDLARQPYFYKTPTAGRYFLLAGFDANPNYFGEFLAMNLFIALGLLLSTSSPKLKLFLSIVLAVNCFEMVAVYNRAGWFGIFVALGFAIFGILFARIYVFKRISKPGLITGIFILALVLTLTGVIFNRRETDETPLSFTPWERLKSMTDFSQDETFRNRLTMWRAAGFMLTDQDTFPQRLIFGGGFGFFEVEYLPYQTKVLETYNFNEWFHNVIPTFRAHNDHIQMLVEAGIIGTSFYALFFILFFVAGLRYIRDIPDVGVKLYGLALMCSVMVLLGVACFSFPLHKIQHGGLGLCVMGFLLADITQRKVRLMNKADEEKISDEQVAVSRKKKKKLEKLEEKPEAKRIRQYPEEFYFTIRKRIRPEIAVLIGVFTFILTVWGVYTQVINFKSHYLVNMGIYQLRVTDAQEDETAKQAAAQKAAELFWRGYQLDPTNGRSEFFHGFALTKKNTYEDAVAGTNHLEEGQLLYPQSDTFYALGMGYEARRRLATQLADYLTNSMPMLRERVAQVTDDAERAQYEERIAEYEQKITEYRDDSIYSHNKAIDAYRTAAQYYPVKVEYYKELIRLLREQERYEDIVFWAERSIVVYDWLLKAPPIRGQLLLWLGEARRALGGKAFADGDTATGNEQWVKAEDALREAMTDPRTTYHPHHELGQIYEARGDMATTAGNTDEAFTWYEQARDEYIEAFRLKDRVPSNEAPFNYAYLLLGRIYDKLGDTARALDYYHLTLTESLYSKNTPPYQSARQRIYELTGVWEGEPADQPVQQTSTAQDEL